MSGARFGDCKCGHAKSEHSAAALAAGPAPPPVHAHGAQKEAPGADTEYHGPCSSFNGMFNKTFCILNISRAIVYIVTAFFGHRNWMKIILTNK